MCKLVDVDLLFQSLMPLLTSDLYGTCKACVEGNLKAHLPQFDCRQTALGVVLVSGGYPGAYPKWKEITGTSVNQASIVHHCRPVECKLWLMCSIMTGAVSAGIQTVLSLCRNTTCAVSVQEYRLCYLCAGIQAVLSLQKYKPYYLCAEIQPVLSLCRNTACAIYVQKYKLCYLCAGIQTVLSVCRNTDCAICVQEYKRRNLMVCWYSMRGRHRKTGRL